MKLAYLPVFFGLVACSWMPHWSCHYYRIETGNSFVVGSWNSSITGSLMLMLVYTSLIALNLSAIIGPRLRFPAALLSGIFHLALAGVHIFRLISPFEFIVFGYQWPEGASLREVVATGLFGCLCIWVVIALWADRQSS